MPVLNHNAENMRGFLKKKIVVQEEHPMTENFYGDNFLADIISRVADIYNNTDDGLFKFKTKLGDEDEANVVVSQDGEDQYFHNDKNYDTSNPEDADQHFLTHQRDILINDIIKVIVRESEVEPNCDGVNK